ncbi:MULTISPECIES: Ig-like domain-containing protein [Streptomyces]|uniref:Ig-like domain-containing protein n=1 Tax=Streptomyces caniscabiei TaxID=2746961 RepID=A0ABU4MHC3_9ACTN|nr:MULTISPECIES: Ig-like domain-containing protein [Streptomyces]MDX2943076.1 Ig-like domain-containing protein [Streptomyces caniscabiei]MDX2952293.1 Ig-like domain-containing protein [Streptomyces caniscabiei]MDX2985638.1 Ig-like domain-containing protein [Streptomyces caniscabiei]MDX3009343.1 Ig-like domain-containing protein [Streptomyces caniscabiei]MDX3036197.1 Ig-like domain-containing protein [Streptomyces caniscabiei]
MIAATAACVVAFALAGCAGSGEGVRVEGPSEIPRAQARADAQGTEEGTEEGVEEGGTGGDGTGTSAKNVNAGDRTTPLPAFDGVRVGIAEGQTVGVGMPISVTFARPVPKAEREAVERQLKVTMDDGTDGTEGGWGWVEDRALADGQRVDFRPRTSWRPGTKITVEVGADLVRHVTVGPR